MLKRALIMMDMSGIGRCALTVALPVLSAMGMQACPLPLGVLSAHTGGFGAIARQDLSDFADSALAHYRVIDAKFDALYSGYLMNDGQLRTLRRAIEDNRDAFILIDPVMADHGKYYSGIGDSRAEGYRALLPMADLVTPNATEAHLLLNADKDLPPDRLLGGLLSLGCKAALVKGIGGVNHYRAQSGDMISIPYRAVEGAYPGTGDLFASIILGALMQNRAPSAAIELAAGFVSACIEHTRGLNTPAREGVCFEQMLTNLQVGVSNNSFLT